MPDDLLRGAQDDIDLGDDHRIVFTSFDGEKRVGGTIIHRRPDGSDCSGFVAFTGRAWAKAFNGQIITWEMVKDEPVTLSPSILCRVCGDHGFVREGKWVRA